MIGQLEPVQGHQEEGDGGKDIPLRPLTTTTPDPAWAFSAPVDLKPGS